MARQDITDATGFDNGDQFDSADEVREYFTIESMSEMYGGNWEHDYPDIDQAALDEMAEAVISNRWHCNF